jgi:hypothetical protein
MDGRGRRNLSPSTTLQSAPRPAPKVLNAGAKLLAASYTALQSTT